MFKIGWWNIIWLLNIKFIIDINLNLILLLLLCWNVNSIYEWFGDDDVMGDEWFLCNRFYYFQSHQRWWSNRLFLFSGDAKPEKTVGTLALWLWNLLVFFEPGVQSFRNSNLQMVITSCYEAQLFLKGQKTEILQDPFLLPCR